MEKIVLKGGGKREFFRYIDGHLAEFDLSHKDGEAILLEQEEWEGMREIGDSNGHL